MSVPVNLQLLRETRPDLYKIVVKQAHTMTGTEEIDEDSLPSELRYDLIGWVNDHEEPPQAPPPPPKQELEIFKIDPDETQRQRKAEADTRAGLARLQQYVDEQNLEPSSENAAAVRAWLDANASGYMSAAGIDLAIQCLGPKGQNALKWAQPKPATLPSQPSSAVRTLKSGEPELPLDATPSQMRKASKEQLQDLSHRRGEGRQRSGWTSARF